VSSRQDELLIPLQYCFGISHCFCKVLPPFLQQMFFSYAFEALFESMALKLLDMATRAILSLSSYNLQTIKA